MKPKVSSDYEGIQKYRSGEWNHCHSKDLDDGSVSMVLSSVNSDIVYRFRVLDFGGENELVLEYEEKKGGET